MHSLYVMLVDEDHQILQVNTWCEGARADLALLVSIVHLRYMVLTNR
jgi:hypothetical protein